MSKLLVPAEVKLLAERVGVPLERVLLGAFQILLAAYKGQADEVSVGVVEGGQVRACHTVPAAAATVRDLLAEQQESTEEVETDGLLVLGEYEGAESAQITLQVSQAGNEWALRFANHPPRMPQHYLHLLQQIAADAERAPLELEIVDAEERELLLHGFQASQEPFPSDVTVLSLFEKQAAETPDATAVVQGDESLTFAQLNERANRRARLLRAKGVGPDVIVGMMLERSLELPVTILAIWKAGGAYLPIDLHLPAERKSYMLEDSRSPVLVTKPQWLDNVEFAGEVFDVTQAQQEEEEAVSGEPLDAIHGPNDLTYIIYTSGTTGKPKGVAVEHRNIANTLQWRLGEYRFNASDVSLQLFSVSFDGFLISFFTPVLSGGCAVFPTDDEARDPYAIKGLIETHGITCIISVPSLYSAVLDVIEPGGLPSLRIYSLGGEKVSRALAEKSLAKLPHVELVNEYGPTETTVSASIYRNVEVAENIPIGKPFTNTRMTILAPNDKLVPVGVAGELCISGSGIVRGYLHRPELTAEKFVPHPYLAGETMYRTGDLARWTEDGNIEYLGRIDHQIKVRGYRVEAGEIENELIRHQAVREALVVGREDERGRTYLVAYLVTEAAIPVAELREHLGRSLPGYMIPSYFVELERFPLTTIGKVDLHALPEPDLSAASTGTAYEAPRNETEALLVELWQEALGVDKLGIRDDFWELGGHSLQAMMLLGRIKQHVAVEMALKDLFAAPTIAELAVLVAGASPSAKQEELRAVEGQSPFYPTTSPQKRMYALSQFEHSGVNYNLPYALVLEGSLDEARMGAALQQLVARHESLRTSFHAEDGEVVQRIHAHAELFIEAIEVKDGSIEDALKRFVRPFDLSQAPLARAGIGRLEENRWLLVTDMPHISSDGVSTGVLIQDLIALYEGKELAALPLQYKDFAVWQQERTGGADMQAHESFWLDHLGGELPVLQLPTDRPRPAMMDIAGETLTKRIDAEAVRRIAQETRTTPYMVLMSAYNILLAKYSGQEDIIVGTVTAGRHHAGLQRVIGMFVETLALRNQPEGTKTVRAFLAEVKSRALAAFEHSDYPLEQLVSALQIPRDPGRNPLFDAVLAVENMEIPDWSGGGLIGGRYEWDPGTARFDLALLIEEKDGSLDLHWEYRTSLFERETVDRLHRHFQQVLEEMANGLDRTIGELELVTAMEKEQLLREFQPEPAPYADDLTVLALFEQKTAEMPEQTAVVYRDQQLSYRELNERAAHLAQALRERGARPNEVVGILVTPSLEMIVGILGILKSGAAYLPIDPDYPDDRVLYMLEDSGAGWLLTQSGFLGKHAFAGQVLNLEDADLYAGAAPELETLHEATDLAYMIYTSGSTGKPKGVMVEHRSLVNLCLWHNAYYEVTSADRATKYAGFGFDASVWEVWPYLAAGATLHVIPEELRLDVDGLNAHYERHGVTISFLPTQIAEQFMQLPNRTLRALLTGGDKLRTFKENGYTLYNNYGPTENTVVATAAPVRELLENIPIGKPVTNARLYILDRFNRLQPVGVEGELCIAGKSLARGYRNLPEMTAEKFVADPFVEGERMYRTGDRARWLPDGSVEFLGRIDHQVKIRGYRIELGEIEHQLLSHPAVREGIVAAKDGVLCAYAVLADEAVTPNELKLFLGTQLAEYMVPTHIIPLLRMPLTPNGKVDLKALPDPILDAAPEADYAAPRFEAERVLAQVWEDVLGVGRVGIRDHFYSLGGDSIKAIQVSSRLQKHGYQLDVKHILQHHTIEALSLYMKQRQQQQIDQGLVTGEAELTPIQTWFMEKTAKVLNHFNQSMLLHRAEGFDSDALALVFEKIVEHHDALRTVFTDGKMHVRGLEQPGFAMETFEIADTAEIEALANRIQSSFDIETGPLVKLGLFRTKAGGDYLLIAIHHLVVDGVSWRILLEDAATAYQQLIDAQGIVLQDKTLSFRGWSDLLRAYAKSDALLAERDYWANVCAAEIPQLSGERPAIGHLMQDSRAVTFELTASETETLLKETNAAYNTEINDILLTALSLSMQEATGRSKLMIHLESHGREAVAEGADTTRTVGWFTSMYPVVLDTAGKTEPGDAVKLVKESLRSIPNKGIGYGILRYLAGAMELEIPAPEIAFNFLGQFDQEGDNGVFAISDLPRGSELHPEFDLLNSISIEGIVIGGRLRMSFHYSCQHFDEPTVQRMADLYQKALLTVISHCANKGDRDFTPSDFTSSDLDFDTLDAVFDALENL